jgi:hypothetical protein
MHNQNQIFEKYYFFQNLMLLMNLIHEFYIAEFLKNDL